MRRRAERRRLDAEATGDARDRDDAEPATAGGAGTAPPGGVDAVDYAFALDGGEPPCPTRAAPGSRTACTARAAPSTRAAFAWTDGDWRGTRDRARACSARSSTSCTSARSRRRAPSTRRSPGSTTSSTLGVDVVELMPVAAFPGRWGWGYDGVGLYAVHDGLRRPGRPASASSTPATRAASASCLDVVYNHLGAERATTSREFGPYFTDAPPHAVGRRRSTSTTPGSDEVRRFVVDNAAALVPRLPRRRAAARRRARARDDSRAALLAELSDEVAALATELGRPLDLIAESDLNDPSTVTPTAEGGRGMTAQWDDDVHHALHVALTGETQGYYADFAGGTEAWPRRRRSRCSPRR